MKNQRSDAYRNRRTAFRQWMQRLLIVWIPPLTLLTAAAVIADNPARVATASGETLSIEIVSPENRGIVDTTASHSVVLSGRVGLGSRGSGPDASVVYVLDVSGSTKSDGVDCNHDKRIDSGDNFAPVDAATGTILDCESGAVMALNDSLGSYRSIYTAVIIFATNAETVLGFSSPPDRDENNNQIPDLDEALVQLDQGGGIVRVGGKTNFAQTVSEITRLMKTRPTGDIKIAYFLTDGRSRKPVTEEAIAARNAGIRIETYAIGNGTDTCRHSPLQEIADLTGGSCTDVENIYELSSTLVDTDNQPAFPIDQASIAINGTIFDNTAVDKFGNWTYIIGAPVLDNRANVVSATVTSADGASAQADIQFDLVQ